MKSSNAVLIAAGALAQLADAQPHAHRHLHPRAEVIVTDVVTDIVYETVTAGFVNHQFSWPHNWSKTKTSDSSSTDDAAATSSTSAAAQSTTLITSTSVAESSAPTSTTSDEATATSAPASSYAASSYAAPSSVASSAASSAAASSAASSVAASSTTSSVVASSAASSAAATATGSSGAANPFTTNGIKAGLSGYVGIGSTDAFADIADYIGWYSDYTGTTADVGDVQGIPMLWGNGQTCLSSTDDAARLTEFKAAVAVTTPKIMFGFYEPDCDCPMSSDISDPTVGAANWNSLIAPLADKGTILGSPSMCKQYDETWLTPFKAAGLDADWDVTSIHINKNTLAGVQEDVEYYASTYGKPLWVSEFACVDDTDEFVACTDQDEINTFINEVVAFFEGNSSVIAYGASNGEGLGTVWPLTSNGALTATGTTYINALKTYGTKK